MLEDEAPRNNEFLSLLDYLEPQASRLALKNLEPPKCEKLRELRTDLGLTLTAVCSLYSLVQALALMGELTVDARHRARVTFPGIELQLDQIRAANLQEFLGQIDSLDITHLSKFERGQQIPWTRARARLTLLFSLIYGKRLEISDVFPELENHPGLRSAVKPNNLLEV